MKKIILAMIALMILGPLKAQDFSIGPKIGVSQGSISVNGEGFETGESQLGYHVGAFVRMGGNSIYIQPEFLYTNTGGNIKEESDGAETLIYEANFNRLDIPLMFGFKMANFFRVQAGPIASVLLDYQLEDAFKVAQDVDYKSSSVGYQAGVGLDLGNLILDLKYEGSLSKMSNNVASFQTDQRQNQFILSAGFRLF